MVANPKRPNTPPNNPVDVIPDYPDLTLAKAGTGDDDMEVGSAALAKGYVYPRGPIAMPFPSVEEQIARNETRGIGGQPTIKTAKVGDGA